MSRISSLARSASKISVFLVGRDQLAESLTTKKITTDELCVKRDGEEESTCITRDQVDQLIELLPTPTPEPSSTPEPSVEPSPIPSPDSSPDPIASESAQLD